MARPSRARYSGEVTPHCTMAASLLTTENGNTENGKYMSTRKKNAGLPRQGKLQQTCHEIPPLRRPSAAHMPDIESLLMVGSEHIVINQEENDNIGFMAELIEPI